MSEFKIQFNKYLLRKVLYYVHISLLLNILVKILGIMYKVLNSWSLQSSRDSAEILGAILAEIQVIKLNKCKLKIAINTIKENMNVLKTRQ